MTSRRFSALYPHIIVWLLITAGAVYFLCRIDHFINLGIDLVGGTYVTLQVELDKAYASELYDKTRALVDMVKRDEVQTVDNWYVLENDKEGVQPSARVVFNTAEQASQAYSKLMQSDKLKDIQVDKASETSLSVALTQAAVNEIRTSTVESNVQALRGRVDEFGVAEVSVVPYGEDKIIVELPSVHDLQRAKAMIGRAALLEVKPVIDYAQSEDDMRDKYDDDLPEDTQIYSQKGKDGVYLLPQYTDLTGRNLKTARVVPGGLTGTQPTIQLNWDQEGQKKFYEMTKEHVGDPVAIVIDSQVISAPVVQQAIGEQASITGPFSQQEAQELAKLLQSGSFAAPVKFAEERHIGPQLGQEAINQGLVACSVSLALLFLFSVFVYKLAGIFAFVVLLYNLVFMLLMLAGLNATLTLPGIAGMILTVGMAIDASILIYERIKEELARGQNLKSAVESGFSGATAVILDANITHLLISIVLYQLGTGPIQGFGITMIVGILSTLITGLWLLRYIFKVITDIIGINKIAI